VADVGEIPWNWVLIRASGITAWGLLTAVVVVGLVLATRLPPRLASAPRLLPLHRWLGALALAFTGLHMALLLIDPVEPFTVVEILVPFTAPWEPVAVALGTIALWLLLPVSVIGRLRSRVARVGGAWFTRAHWLAYAAWPLATAHYVLAGTDALTEWSLGLLITGTVLVVVALLLRGNAHRRPRRPTLTR
jgi:DMSO/TMAO reductase YedYZ heme-binding membrane subunit